MLEDLKKQLWEGYTDLSKKQIFSLKKGSISMIHRSSENIVIMPKEANFQLEDICVVDKNGILIEGKEPASDCETHIELYKMYPEIESILFSQSGFTMIWAQMKERIRPFSTFHAEYFRGEILCAEVLDKMVRNNNFYVGVANAIKETMNARSTFDMPGILVAQHGAYVWGKDLKHTINVLMALEEIAKSAWHMVSVSGLNVTQIPFWLLESKFAEVNKK